MTTADLQQLQEPSPILPNVVDGIMSDSTVIVECNSSLLSDYYSEEEEQESEELSFDSEDERYVFDDDEEVEDEEEDEDAFNQLRKQIEEGQDQTDSENEGDSNSNSTDTPDSENSFDDIFTSESNEDDLLGVPQRYKNLLISSDPLADETSVIRIMNEDCDVLQSFSLFHQAGMASLENDDSEEEDDKDYTDDEEEQEQNEEEDETESDNDTLEETESSYKRKAEHIDSDEDTWEDIELEDDEKVEKLVTKRPQMMDRLIQLSQTKRPYSKIPVPTRGLKNSIKTKTKLPPLEINCEPISKDTRLPLRSAFKTYDSPILNLFINSSSGLLSESTRYATEINSVNGVGITLPKTVNELVSIPVNANATMSRRGARSIAKPNKQPKKIAYLKGLEFAHTREKEHFDKKGENQVGFYTPDEFRKYMWRHESCTDLIDEVVIEENDGLTTPVEGGGAMNDLEVTEITNIQRKRPSKRKKKLRWADELEW